MLYACPVCGVESRPRYPFFLVSNHTLSCCSLVSSVLLGVGAAHPALPSEGPGRLLLVGEGHRVGCDALLVIGGDKAQRGQEPRPPGYQEPGCEPGPAGWGPHFSAQSPPPALTGTGCGWQEPGWTLRGRQLVGMGRDAVSVGQDGGFLESRCQFSGLAGAEGQGAGQTPLPPRPPTRPGILESQRL